MRWYRKAAVKGHASAQCSLGICYHDGDGTKRNFKKGMGDASEEIEEADVAEIEKKDEKAAEKAAK